MRHSLLTLALSCLAFACSSELPPTSDAGPPSNDAGPTTCPGGTDALTGRCLEGLGAGVACPTGEFSNDHQWQANATNARYVATNGSGDGHSANTPAATLETALTGVNDEAVVFLGAGDFDIPEQLPAKLALIGRCAGETSLSLGLRGPIHLNTGEQLRLWGVSLTSQALESEQGLVMMAGEGELEVHQSHFEGSADGLQIHGRATLNHNTFAALGGRAIDATGPLSGVIIGDNNFLGPLGGDGVFLGPLGGDGVFSISGNSFGDMIGSGLVVTDARSGVIIGDNNFLGPLGGDGVFVGPAEGGIAISGNRFTAVSGDAVVLQDVTGNAQINANTVAAPSPGTGGSGVVLLDLSGGLATLTGNTVVGATSMAIVIERVSSEVQINDNMIEGTVPPADTGGNHLRSAYGVAIMDSKTVSLNGNTIKDNASAGVVFDQTNWGNYVRRQELSGGSAFNFTDNVFANNHDRNMITQNMSDDAEMNGSAASRFPGRGDDDQMPMESHQGRAECGDGQISGAEDCDINDPNSQFICAANCRLTRHQRSTSGTGFSCFLTRRHRIQCVGQQINSIFNPGQPDQGGNYPIQGPTGAHPPETGPVVAIAAGRRHLCALALDGTVLCWGDKSQGQVGQCLTGQGAVAPGTVKTVGGADLTRVSGVSAYGDTTCAWTHEGALFCWGESTYGQTGTNEPVVPCATMVGDELSFDVRQAAVGNGFTCAITDSNEVRCFGRNDAMQLGAEETNNTCRVGRLDIPCSRQPFAPVAKTAQATLRATALSAGRGVCAIATQNGGLYCWGPRPNYDSAIPLTETPYLGRDHDLGQGAAKCQSLSEAKIIALGDMHGCVVDLENNLKCWSTFGHVWSGNGDELSTQTPSPVTDEGQVINAPLALTVGQTHTCLVEADRSVSCWGDWPTADGTPDAEQLRLEFDSRLP